MESTDSRIQHSKRNLTPQRKRSAAINIYLNFASSCRYVQTTPLFANAKNVQNEKLQKDLDAQINEIKDLCAAIGSKDADIAALKEKLSSLLQDTNLQTLIEQIEEMKITIQSAVSNSSWNCSLTPRSIFAEAVTPCGVGVCRVFPSH